MTGGLSGSTQSSAMPVDFRMRTCIVDGPLKLRASNSISYLKSNGGNRPLVLQHVVRAGEACPRTEWCVRRSRLIEIVLKVLQLLFSCH